MPGIYLVHVFGKNVTCQTKTVLTLPGKSGVPSTGYIGEVEKKRDDLKNRSKRHLDVLVELLERPGSHTPPHLGVDEVHAPRRLRCRQTHARFTHKCSVAAESIRRTPTGVSDAFMRPAAPKAVGEQH